MTATDTTIITDGLAESDDIIDRDDVIFDVNGLHVTVTSTVGVGVDDFGRRRPSIRTWNATLQSVCDEVLATARVFEIDAWLDSEAALLFEIADAESGDLAAVAGTLCVHADEIAEQHTSPVARTVIVDSVEVPAQFRGRGLGRLVAAHALIAAGPLDDMTLVAATAGARTADPVEREQITGRAAKLLGALGLEEFGNTGVYLADPALRRFDERLDAALHIFEN